MVLGILEVITATILRSADRFLEQPIIAAPLASSFNRSAQV
jgi:hypothetical protein